MTRSPQTSTYCTSSGASRGFSSSLLVHFQPYFNLLIALVIDCARRNARRVAPHGAHDAASATAAAASAGWRPREPQCVAAERMASIATA